MPAYRFNYYNLATLYIAPVVGAILGIPIGHFLFDICGKLWAKRHGGIIEPEARLLPIWLIMPLKIAGYNMIGVTLGRHWNVNILAVGWVSHVFLLSSVTSQTTDIHSQAMHNLSTILTTSAVSAYLIDAYPEASGESAAWLNFARTLAGFIIGYVQIEWAHASGPELEYGIQTAIMGGVFLLFIVPLTFFGKTIRRKQGPLKFKTN